METKDEPITVIACTDGDMCAGGFGPLPRDPKAVHKSTPEEHAHLIAMFRAFDALRNLGWRDILYASRGSTFLAIEAGSTGIFECERDKDGNFWIYDGDLWPAHPILFKPTPDKSADPPTCRCYHPHGECLTCGCPLLAEPQA